MPGAIAESGSSSVGRKPAEYNSEEIQSENAAHERRDTDSHDARADNGTVDRASTAKRRNDAGWYANQNGNGESVQAEKQRHGKRLLHYRGNRLLGFDRDAEVTVEHTLQPQPVLLNE